MVKGLGAKKFSVNIFAEYFQQVSRVGTTF